MRLALECETDQLELLQPFADFDWILVDRYLSDARYADWYRKSTNVKFVDNSVTEKGEPCTIDELKTVFEDVKGTYVVSPDWIGDYKKTTDAYAECVKSGFFAPAQIVGALQGSTPEEALKCLEVFENRVVLVPYRVGGSVKGDPNWLMALRRQLVVAHIPDEYEIHLLGFTSSDEFRMYTGRANVMSIDTDVPIRAGLVNQDIDDFDRKTDVKKVKLTKENWPSVCRNIAFLRKHMAWV
jgi:hypothetical protein